MMPSHGQRGTNIDELAATEFMHEVNELRPRPAKIRAERSPINAAVEAPVTAGILHQLRSGSIEVKRCHVSPSLCRDAPRPCDSTGLDDEESTPRHTGARNTRLCLQASWRAISTANCEVLHLLLSRRRLCQQ